MSIIELKPKKRTYTPRDLVPLDKTSGAARYRAKMKRDIEKDLGGRRNLTRIELEQIDAYCGAASRLDYLIQRIERGDDHDVDPASYSQLASTMLRIGSKLGLSRRAKNVTTLGELIRADQAAERARLAREREQQTEASS